MPMGLSASWGKFKICETADVIVGGVIGTLAAPRELLVGWYPAGGDGAIRYRRMQPLAPTIDIVYCIQLWVAGACR